MCVCNVYTHTDTHTHTHTHNGISLSHKDKSLLSVSTWMDIKCIMLSEMSDRERQILYDLTYMCNVQKNKQTNRQTKKLIKRETRMSGPVRKTGEWERLAKGINFQLED